jgi:hypothetical protein
MPTFPVPVGTPGPVYIELDTNPDHDLSDDRGEAAHTPLTSRRFKSKPMRRVENSLGWDCAKRERKVEHHFPWVGYVN